MPDEPSWFLDLQKRFYQEWEENFKKIDKLYPDKYIFLQKSFRHLRPLTKATMKNKFYEATIEATGKKISVRVLHQTCGHIYTIKNDASMLSKLGWSESFAFDYTWLPREYFVPNKSKK